MYISEAKDVTLVIGGAVVDGCNSLLGFEGAMGMISELEDALSDYIKDLTRDNEDYKKVRYIKAYRAVVDQLALSAVIDVVDIDGDV